jgi:hypothetical protein
MKCLEQRGGEKYMGLENFDRKPEDKRPLGRPRRRWEEGVKVDIRDM